MSFVRFYLLATLKAEQAASIYKLALNVKRCNHLLAVISNLNSLAASLAN